MSESGAAAHGATTVQTPHLGALVQRTTDLEESPFQNMHAVTAPMDDTGKVVPHQVFFRVLVGRAKDWQACLVQRTQDWSDVPDGSAPDWVLGGPWPPRQTDWLQYPATDRPAVYWFTGLHRQPDEDTWLPDAFVGHTLDTYENGSMSTLYYDDNAGDLDADDLIVEVAVVHVGPLEDVRPGAKQAEIASRVAEAVASRTSKLA